MTEEKHYQAAIQGRRDFRAAYRKELEKNRTLETQLAAAQERLKEAKGLLERWNMMEIPSRVWQEPSADYDLPIDTQTFLHPAAAGEESGQNA